MEVTVMFPKRLLAFSLFAAAIFAQACVVRAQWVQTNGPGDGPAVNAFAVIDSDLFAGTDNGIFVTTDNGVNWSAPNPGLTTQVTSLLAHGNDLFAASYSEIYFSIDLGSNWTVEDSAFFANANAAALLLASNGATLFAATDASASFGDPGGNIFQSTNNGVSWVSADTSFPSNVAVLAMLASGNAVFVATSQGVVGSFDEGASWKLANAGLGKSLVMSLASLGPILFAGTIGVMTSMDAGNSWQQASNGLPKAGVTAFTVRGTTIYAGTNGSGVYRSTDSGKNWIDISDGFSSAGLNVYSLVVMDSTIYAGTYSAGVWRRPLSDFGISSVAQTPASKPDIQSYPNPFSQRTTITFTSEAAAYADVRVVNLLGVEVAHLFSGTLSAGEHSFIWSNPTGLPAGMYECVVRMNGQTRRVPMAHAR